MRFQYVIGLFLVVVTMGLLPATSQTAAQTTTTMPEIAAGANAIDDWEIETRIREIFHELDGLENVRVLVRAGVVSLRGNVRETPLADKAEMLASRVDGVVAVTNQIEEETSVTERLVPVYERLETRLLQALNYFPLFIVAMCFWALVSGAGLFLAARNWPWNRIAPNAFIANLIRQIVRILFIVIGAVLALDILGATALLSTLLGAAGIIGLAVGFAVRDTVENYIASILLSIRQPFRPKDFVAIEGFEGFVIALTSRATILMEANGNHIRIPNSTVFKGNIVNYSTNPERRFLFSLGVDSDSDLSKALETGLATIAALEFVLEDPLAEAWIDELGDSNVILTFAGWINQQDTSFVKARSEAMRLVKRALEANGFLLPEPTYRLRFDEGVMSLNAGDSSKPAQKTARDEPAVRAQAESAQPQNTDVDPELEKRVDEERDSSVVTDLLSDEAPNEFGGT
ncbi:MAG: mechanosensitive ion channel family protein [Rhizobiaceae bacterium]|nr:mechanosensitive ion channel family protein [Rhizobiaceae bacterium]